MCFLLAKDILCMWCVIFDHTFSFNQSLVYYKMLGGGGGNAKIVLFTELTVLFKALQRKIIIQFSKSSCIVKIIILLMSQNFLIALEQLSSAFGLQTPQFKYHRPNRTSVTKRVISYHNFQFHLQNLKIQLQYIHRLELYILHIHQYPEARVVENND